MVVPSLIERKRDGKAIAPGEWRELLAAYAAGRVPDYQMAALCMAIFFNGLTPEELTAVCNAMVESGDRLRLDDLGRPRVDKHLYGDRKSVV